MDLKKSSNDKNSKEKICFNCLTKETPLWRRSKKGANLCNACGLYYRNHGEHRPTVRSSDSRHQADKNHCDEDISAMEKIAIRVLTEMRIKARESRRNLNQSFNYREPVKASKSTSPQKQAKQKKSSDSFDLGSLKKRFRNNSSLLDDDPLKPFLGTDDTSDSVSLHNKKENRNNKNFVDFYSKIRDEENSDQNTIDENTQNFGNTDFLLTKEHETARKAPSTKTDAFLPNPSPNSLYQFEKKHNHSNNFSGFRFVSDRDSDDLRESNIARNSRMSD